jgi:2-dehydropantoate 2-reductase
MSAGLRVGIFGAGAIGTFVGGRLAASGVDVTLVGRARVLDPIAREGLTIEDLESATRTVAPGALRCATDASALGGCDVVVVTTKAAGTRDAAIAIRDATPRSVPVVSVQNGVEGPATLRDVLGAERAFGGMIAYNVVFREPTRLRRATSGPLVIERGPGAVARLVDACRAAGLTTLDSPEIERVLWSKLLFNLNNALNALSGLPLRTQLRDRGYRRLMATMMREGIAVMKAQGIRPMRFGTLSPAIASRVLTVPDWIFERAAAAMLKIDPEARSSMAEDLAQRRPTEIDALNGVVVRRGREHGVPTPLNERVVEAVRAAEKANVGSPRLTASDIATAATR